MIHTKTFLFSLTAHCVEPGIFSHNQSVDKYQYVSIISSVVTLYQGPDATEKNCHGEEFLDPFS